jgi:hypothetical protein
MTKTVGINAHLDVPLLMELLKFVSRKILVICSLYKTFRAHVLGLCTSLIYLSGYVKIELTFDR